MEAGPRKLGQTGTDIASEVSVHQRAESPEESSE